MSQFSIILSSKYDSQGRSGSFTNELPQALNFALNKDEKWRMSLAELTYHPGAMHNIRKTNNSIELRITDFAILTWMKRKIFYLSWEFIKEPQHVFQPGIIKNYLTWSKTFLVIPSDFGGLINTLHLAPVSKLVPGNKSNFVNFKSENRDKPCLRLYVYRSVKWREDIISTTDVGLIEIPQKDNVEAEFEIWDSEYNKNPQTKMYKFHLNYQLNEEYRTNLAPYSMETMVAWTTWGMSGEWTEDEYKPMKRRNRRLRRQNEIRARVWTITGAINPYQFAFP